MISIDIDTTRDELHALVGEVTASGTWTKQNEILKKTDAKGRVVALVIPGFRKRSGNLMADLIAQHLGIERDEAVQAVRTAIARQP